MSDTPETDAFFFRTDIEWDDEVTFARKLERERDEARHEIVGWRNKWEAAIEMGARAMVERDEAIDRFENFSASSIHSCHDECRRPMCVLRRERDESRREAEYYKARYEQLKDQHDLENAKLRDIAERLCAAYEAGADLPEGAQAIRAKLDQLKEGRK